MRAGLAILSSLIFLTSLNMAQAKDKKDLLEIYFSFEHPTCKLRVIPLVKEDQYLKKALEEKLSERSFNYDYLENSRELKKGELYLTIEKTVPKEKAYRDCIIFTKLKQAEYDHRTSREDRTLYKKEVRRAFPRITFEGKERCTRALKDTFVNIPFCKIIKNK